MTIRAGRRLDAAALSARAEATRAAEGIAHGRERARAEALLHNGVLATLLAAGRSRLDVSAPISLQAHRTLDELDSFRAGIRELTDLTPRGFTWRLQAIATEIAPEAPFSHASTGSDLIPGDVVEAFAEAAAEALRNSVLHGDTLDRVANRAVHVECSDRGTAVTVLDDGRGFSPAAVGALDSASL